MNKKELYQQKLQAQLDVWQAEVDKMKAQLGGASVGAKMEINQQINNLEDKLADGKKKLKELSEATEENWESIKADIDNLAESISDSFKEQLEKIK